jgi:hypothetical protein
VLEGEWQGGQRGTSWRGLYHYDRIENNVHLNNQYIFHPFFQQLLHFNEESKTVR